MTMRIDQMTAGYADGDAISSEARAVRAILRAQGFDSDLYSDIRFTGKSLRGDARDYTAYTSGDVLIYHYSIGSPVLDTFMNSSARKVLIYHNITPSEYYRPYDAGIARQLVQARDQLETIGKKVDAVWADSEFNASELSCVGVDNVKVFPLLFNESECNYPDDPHVMQKLSGPHINVLSVGRLAPNKRVEVAIRAFNYYVKKINPYSRFVIIGSGRSCPGYYDMLQMMVGDLDIPNVCFEGFADVKSLPAYYRCADVFLSTSDHEGYCLPLVEAMYHGVPVLAHKTGGTPEAMGGAGVLYENLDPSEIAVLLDDMCSNKQMRLEIISSQSRRIEDIKNRQSHHELIALLKPLMNV